MIIRAFFSFFVSSSTAILNKVERKYYIWCGMCGVITSICYSLCETKMTAPLSSLVACVCLTIVSQLFAKWTHRPSLIFTISGIMPIVPGSLLFKTFNALAQQEYANTVSYGTQAILVGVSIALGFFVNESMAAILLRLRIKKRG